MLDEVKRQAAKNHQRMMNRLENRLKKRKSERTKLEAVYYGGRMILVLLFIYVSILSMVGASYTPFLYNQF